MLYSIKEHFLEAKTIKDEITKNAQIRNTKNLRIKKKTKNEAINCSQLKGQCFPHQRSKEARVFLPL